jgi:hypothetical protein
MSPTSKESHVVAIALHELVDKIGASNIQREPCRGHHPA